jgi:rhodanese-related sulfurtransferase
MRKFFGLTAIVMTGMLLVFMIGCGGDDDGDGGTTPTPTEFETLVAYMTANNLDLPAMLSDWTISAQTLFDGGLENYFVIDIRMGDICGPDSAVANGVVDFEDGHIDGAHGVALANVVSYESANNSSDLPVVVYCYTGHSAGHAVMALRLSGVTDARSLVWGFSAWHEDFDLWTSKTGNVALDYQGAWSTTAPAELPVDTARPTLNTAEASGAAILAYRITTAVLDGLNGINNTDVLGDYDNYHVLCYWSETDWNTYGHITNAYQIAPGTLGLESLDLLDMDGINVVYCWSGQTASMVAAWLNVLGYDGKTLKFSSNGMIYDDLTSHKWGVNATPAGLDYVTGP